MEYTYAHEAWIPCHTLQASPWEMSNPTHILGDCPFCGAKITSEAVLVEFETDGQERIFAECYECNEPVEPQ